MMVVWRRLLRTKQWAVASVTGALVAGMAATSAWADRIENDIAVFSALDKVTARISKFEVELGKSAKFGALTVTPRACYSRPQTEQPKTTSFVEVDEQELDGESKRIFTGWMFAESPGLYGVEHPTYDVWLTGCRKPLKTTAQTNSGATTEDGKAPAAAPAARDDFLETRRRLRR